MKLEKQLEKLAELGLPLNAGITVDDLIYSFDREAYEESPFDLVLFALGVEVERQPWGRSICSRVWNFDTECIVSSGDYVTIVERLCELSGEADYLTDVSDHVDLETGEARLKYKVNDTERNWKVQVNDDWADMMTMSDVMDDIERDGKRFYFKDNGQAMILFFLDSDTATELNRLSNGALKTVNPK
jgi:hypothetical protein